MPEKKMPQDIVPIKIHKIHEERLPPAHSAHSEPSKHSAPLSSARIRHFEKPKRVKRPRNRRMRKIWLIFLLAAACVACIIAAITYVYARAVVIITPKSEDVSVNGTFTASKDGSPLPYEVIQTSETATTSIAASQGPLVADKAWGMVILYNAYSAAPQKLLEGTHLSNDKGLIYTTASTVTIPGVHKTPTAANPNATSTGSVSVYVVAEEPGASYDIAPTDLTGDFRIVAFQGGPKYAGFYGRLKPTGKGIIGGYSGYREIIATSTLTSATAELTQTVASALKFDLKALVPSGYVLYNGAYGMNFSSTTVSVSTSTAVTSATTAGVSLKGSLYGIMFKKTDLAKAVAPAQVEEFPPNQYSITGMESLTFTPADPAAFQQMLSSENSAPITFALNGSFGLVGTFPSGELTSGLVGLSLPQSKAVFAKYSTIMSAHAIITPFWKHSFPDSSDKITIDIQQ